MCLAVRCCEPGAGRAACAAAGKPATTFRFALRQSESAFNCLSPYWLTMKPVDSFKPSSLHLPGEGLVVPLPPAFAFLVLFVAMPSAESKVELKAARAWAAKHSCPGLTNSSGAPATSGRSTPMPASAVCSARNRVQPSRWIAAVAVAPPSSRSCATWAWATSVATDSASCRTRTVEEIYGSLVRRRCRGACDHVPEGHE